MDVNLRELRYFVVLAQELHFTRAAERLAISQPALSKRIRALERQLGFDLVERRSREVVLTARGAALLPEAVKVLGQWQHAWRTARSAPGAPCLVIGLQTAVGRDLQRLVLHRFRERMPGCEVALRMVSWSDPTAGLADGDTDVALVWLPAAGPGIRTSTLLREQRWLAMPSDHPLAARSELAFTELLDEPFVAVTREAGPLRDFWLALPERGGRPPVVAAEATSPDEVFEAVSAGLGVVLLAEGNVQLYRRPGVVCRPVTGLAPAELAVAWRDDDDRPQVAEFVAAYRELSAAGVPTQSADPPPGHPGAPLPPVVCVSCPTS